MNEPHPETLFQQSISRRIELIKTMLEQHPNRITSSKLARRSPNLLQHHVTKLTNFLQHRKSCIQGYRAKAQAAKTSKGRNSIAGIPETFLELV
jgi:hypothetical protein